MKKFLLNCLACLVALVVFNIFTSVMSLLMFIALIAAGDSAQPVEKGSILHINLDTTLAERTQSNPWDGLLGGATLTTSGLDVLTAALEEAKTNDRITGVFLEGGLTTADVAQLQELRAALLDFKQSGKFVVAYADQYTQSGYYLASTADTLLLNPSGMVDWHGIASQPVFYKDLLEKIGVKMQIFKVGTYKSAVEPFMLTEMSDANREQVQAFVGDIWAKLVADVAETRAPHSKMKAEQMADSLTQFAARYLALAPVDDYVRLGLVDSLCYADGARDVLRRYVADGEVKLAEAADVAALADRVKATKPHVAVYYASGSIVDVPGSGAVLGGTEEIVGDVFVADLDALASDENVCAVVLRINSGGGSAYASEQMWRAVQLLKAKKPVVVSMSGLAASGGYYTSCGADYIFADHTTLTGSIGIFGMVPDASELLTDKLGLHFDVVRTNEGADFGAMGRPFSDGEAAAMQAYVERGYDLFLTRVAEARSMTKAAVDSIAQGRVWTGHQALALGLVDEIGGLPQAIAKAKDLAGKDAGIKGTVAYPAAQSWLEQLMQEVSGESYMERKARLVLGDYYRPLHFVGTLPAQSRLQARMPYELRLIH